MEKQKTIFKDKDGYFIEQDGNRIYVKPVDSKEKDESKWTFTDGTNTYTPSQVQERRPKYSSAYDPYALTDLLDWTAENTIGLPIKWAAQTETGQKALPYVGKVLSVVQPSKWYGTFTGKGAPWSEKNTGFGDSKHDKSLNTIVDWALSPALVKGESNIAKTVGKEATMQLASKGWSPAVKYVLGTPETKNILNEIIPGQIGWAPAQKITVFHRTDNPMFEIRDFTPERWDAKFHGAPKTGMWVSQKNDIGFLNKRPYEVILTEEVKKPIVQIGDISTTWKNKTRNKIFEYAKQNGADVVQFKNIKDNKTNGQNVDFIFNPSENLKIQLIKKPVSSNLSAREYFGLSKGAYGDLNKFQKQALEDYWQYKKSGSKRNKFLFNTEDNTFRYGDSIKDSEIEGVNKIMSMPGVIIRDEFVRSPNGAISYFPNINQSRITLIPEGYKFGELRATPDRNGFQKSIVLTSPRVDFFNSMIDATPEQLAKLPNRIPKEDMKRFWETVDQTTKPGTYLSGDAGAMPLGGFMITAKTPSESSKVLLADAADLNSLNRRTGLSPDSYKAIIKQGLRPGHHLRFSRNTFMKLNSSAVDNAHLYDQWKAATTPELKQQFVKDWNEQIYPRTAFINKDGKIEFLQPFVFYRKNGGLLEKTK